MDNELILVIGDKELHFKLKSQKIVALEKLYGKNIFDIFQNLSFTTMQRILWESLINKNDVDGGDYGMMDLLLTKYDLVELGGDVMQKLAVTSGLLKASAFTDTDNPKN